MLCRRVGKALGEDRAPPRGYIGELQPRTLAPQAGKEELSQEVN